MTLDKPIVFLTTNDPAASREFYESALGLNFIADEPFALVFHVGPITLRIQKIQELQPAAGTVFGFEVENIHAAIDHLHANGVLFERFPGMEQDDHNVWQTPSGAKVAWFKDPVGNLLSLTQTP